jgi:zinc and cadmium transporter
MLRATKFTNFVFHMTALYAIGSVLLISLFSFTGVLALALRQDLLRKYVFLLVSLAVGGLLGDAFFHLIPESFEAMPGATTVPLAIVAGILAFFAFEKILHWHHHRLSDEGSDVVHPTGRMILISDGIHNFVDGLIVAASYMVSVEIGIATTLAIILHEIPQEIGDFGVLIHSGYKVAQALWFNFLSALAAVVGALVAILLGDTQTLMLWLIPFAAGGFIYIAMSDLIPELHRTHRLKNSVLQVIVVLIGILAMLALLSLE